MSETQRKKIKKVIRQKIIKLNENCVTLGAHKEYVHLTREKLLTGLCPCTCVPRRKKTVCVICAPFRAPAGTYCRYALLVAVSPLCVIHAFLSFFTVSSEWQVAVGSSFSPEWTPVSKETSGGGGGIFVFFSCFLCFFFGVHVTLNFNAM